MLIFEESKTQQPIQGVTTFEASFRSNSPAFWLLPPSRPVCVQKINLHIQTVVIQTSKMIYGGVPKMVGFPNKTMGCFPTKNDRSFWGVKWGYVPPLNETTI